jgi:TonB family protein
MLRRVADVGDTWLITTLDLRRQAAMNCVELSPYEMARSFLMREVRQGRVAQNAHSTCVGVLLLVPLVALSMNRVVAQSETTAPAGQADRPAEQIDEITVIGQRSLRELRLEVQIARERVYDLFNSLNSHDEFNIYCYNVPRTGTRIPQRVCRPQYTDSATREASTNFLLGLVLECNGGPMDEFCTARVGFSRAQGALSVLPIKDLQLTEEVRRLTRENTEFRRAITEFQLAESRYEVARRAERPEIRASASIVDTIGAISSPRRAGRQDAYVVPQPIDLVTPDIPRSGLEANARRQGWVKLRYSVLADGTTADVRVVDAMPPGLDPSDAVAAVQAWRFEPATAERAPIDWHNNLAVIVFSGERVAPGNSLEFAEAYEDTAALISAADYEVARLYIERMQSETVVTLEEMGLVQMQLAAIEHALGDPHAALHAIRRATEAAIPQLADEALALALEHRFALELELGLAADALATFERRAALTRLRSRDPLARQGAALREALEAPEANFAVHARTDTDGGWEHALTWSTFAFDEVDGRNMSLGVECNRNKAVLPLETDMEMTIPAAWGECALLVEGPPETSFILYEFREPSHHSAEPG